MNDCDGLFYLNAIYRHIKIRRFLSCLFCRESLIEKPPHQCTAYIHLRILNFYFVNKNRRKLSKSVCAQSMLIELQCCHIALRLDYWVRWKLYYRLSFLDLFLSHLNTLWRNIILFTFVYKIRGYNPCLFIFLLIPG